MGAATTPERGFHAGERAVQQRAGTLAQADRLARMVDEPDLRGGTGQFLAERTFAALSARDTAGRLWVSPLTGTRGFLHLAVDPAAALLFVDFPAGRALHLSGTARVEWEVSGAGDDGGTGRRVWFDVEAVVAGVRVPLHASDVEPYRRNPALT